MWDSRSYPCKWRPVERLTFNSLCEILQTLTSLSHALIPLFQFSMWDSNHINRNTTRRRGCIFQFSMWDSRQPPKRRWVGVAPFNSLCEILGDIIKAWISDKFKAFNSLCEIHKRHIRFRGRRNISLSILYVRFLNQLRWWDEADRVFFQFSMWDSVNSNCPARVWR